MIYCKTRYLPRAVLLIATFLHLLVAPLSALPESFAGKVVAVADGDTIGVLREGREVRVRLYGIDAPEKKQDFGSKAKQFVSNQVFGKTVTVESKGNDKYGRTIGVVTLRSGEILNHLIVQNGFAWWYQKYAPHETKIKELEAQARAAKRGLWAKPNPVPPWQFRHPSSTQPQPGSTEHSSKAAPVIGNKKSHIYHLPTCDSYSKVSKANRVPFATEREAKEAGYERASNCPTAGH